MQVSIRNGVNIKISREEAEKLMQVANSGAQFFDIKGRLVNKADLSGVFFDDDIALIGANKRGEYICKYGQYHKHGHICHCNVSGNRQEAPKESLQYLESLKLSSGN